MYPCFMSSLVKCLALFSLYRNSSSVGMMCLICHIAVLAVVISTFILICVGSDFGISTRFDIQSVGLSTSSITSAGSSSSRMASSCGHLEKGIFLWLHNWCDCLVDEQLDLSVFVLSYAFKDNCVFVYNAFSSVPCDVHALFFFSHSMLSTSGVSLAASSSYVMCCMSDDVDVVLVLTACMFMGQVHH